MKKRYNIIDFIRGFAIVNMILYHLFYDLVYIFDENFSFFPSTFSSIWQNLIAMTFIITSGIAYNFGKKNSRKFLYLIICSAILSTYTFFFMKNEFIAFGIIHFFAFATLILLLIDSVLKHINSYLGLIVSLLLFASTKFIANGYIYIFTNKYILPRTLYDSKAFFWLGFPSDNFVSSDYYPLIPWFFLFIAGFFIGRIFLSKKPTLKKKSLNPICFIGRHSLLIYMAHQPIIYMTLSFIYKKPLY
ncbi:heparan-alpha-glucosaminide N-acetyltransferase [Miniphocaeibacter massiliensis]|uniref:heparan-alpha-glucosaminide N-acetyltransferase n=1 Tax=Miniphocaeibacter massiliensis TaxID=2041841 RepID=UPI000C1C5633|nr:heparan-alpha-glucosaminide N-acetyltransferase [Miniphocaeibacter massiliensis]